GLFHYATDAGQLSADGLYVAPDEDGALITLTVGRSAAHRDHDLRCRYSLSNVTLSMVRAVDKQAADGRGQLRAAYGAWGIELVRRNGAPAGCRGMQTSVQLCHDAFRGSTRIQLAFQSGDLRGVKLCTIGVGQEAVQTARNVAQMEGDRCDAMRARVHFIVTESATPPCGIFFSEFQGVQHSARDRVEIGVRAAQPRFRWRDIRGCHCVCYLRLSVAGSGWISRRSTCGASSLNAPSSAVITACTRAIGRSSGSVQWQETCR